MFDLIIRGGDVIDGLGGTRRRADVGIVGKRITAIDHLDAAVAHAEIDARGLCVHTWFCGCPHSSGCPSLLGYYSVTISASRRDDGDWR